MLIQASISLLISLRNLGNSQRRKTCIRGHILKELRLLILFQSIFFIIFLINFCYLRNFYDFWISIMAFCSTVRILIAFRFLMSLSRSKVLGLLQDYFLILQIIGWNQFHNIIYGQRINFTRGRRTDVAFLEGLNTGLS